ncbi:MAG: trigger factor [Candidatus Hinthialibacter antarcticus]|nr:trigger factor [Candidatus Hinthialibacter antarcticus]
MKILEQQDIGPCTKSLKIEVPPEDVTSELEGVYKEFMMHATVPGFRPGKAPRHIVKMKFGKHLNQEASGKALEAAFEKATEELDIKPVNQPEISDLDELDSSKPIVFEAKFEYVPPFDLADYKDIKPEKPEAEVPEKEIVETLNRLRENSATYETVEDRPAQDDDIVSISSKATIDGEPFSDATHDEIPVQLGTKRYIPGFEEELVGLKKDDEKTFKLTLPEEYPNEEMRGKEAEFEIKVKQIQEKKLPELDDEFAKDMGAFESLAELKDRIREDMEANMEQRAKDAYRQAIRDELLKRNTFPVPPSMVKARYNFINAMQDMELRRYGQSLETAAKEDEGLLARNEETAENEVRLSQVLDKIADEENVVLADEDYFKYIAQMAAANQADPGMYAERIQSQGLESYYRRVALEEKVLDLMQGLAEGDAKPKKARAKKKKTQDADEAEVKAEAETTAKED